jgi:hypothetical protein
MREPSLHIKYSDFKKFLPDIRRLFESGKNDSEVIEWLMYNTKEFCIRGRTHITGNSRQRKKVKKLKDSDVDPSLFLTQLTIVRQNFNHKVREIKEGDSQYITLKQVCADADEFVAYFKLDRAGGYRTYCKLGIEFMKKPYGLNKFKFYKEKIFQSYELKNIYIEDQKISDNKQNTELFVGIWKDLMFQRLRHPSYLENDEDRYAVVLARQEADMLKADYRDYLSAQFEAMDAYGFLPELGALYGHKAVKRYRTYMYEKSKGKEKDKYKEGYESQLSVEERKKQEIRERYATD